MRTSTIWASLLLNLGDRERTLLHLRSVQFAPNCRELPRNWSWSSGTPMESVLQKTSPPHGLAIVEFSGQLFFSLSC
jgi:hypothetical protein